MDVAAVAIVEATRSGVRDPAGLPSGDRSFVAYGKWRWR
jgi:hypothetical protein